MLMALMRTVHTELAGIDLDRLLLLDVLLSERHATRAAARLGATQRAASHAGPLRAASREADVSISGAAIAEGSSSCRASSAGSVRSRPASPSGCTRSSTPPPLPLAGFDFALAWHERCH